MSQPKTSTDLSVFECKICFEYMEPPFYQCSEGHLVCTLCLRKIDACPECRGPKRKFLGYRSKITSNYLAAIRNRALETLIESHMVLCCYSSHGCTQKYFGDKARLAHEQACKFRPYPCVFKNCNWNGNEQSVLTHLEQEHGPIPVYTSQGATSSTTCRASLNSTSATHFFIRKQQNRAFVGIWEIIKNNENTRYTLSVHLIGTQQEAKKFQYIAKLCRGDRSLTWDAKTLSIFDNFYSPSVATDVLTFDTKIAQQYATDGKFELDFTLKQC
ncbi:E3 ubiquitin-protein ligase Siah1-like protein [Aphelenchoides bicaudatus]|nr:E3 ubiquitin-protein ligase Siah1-like protein [Aphelenchoides bicaudatus]